MTGSSKLILWLSLLVGLVTYSFWPYLGKGSFYIGNSLFILLLCVFLFKKYGKTVISFLLLCLSLSNFIDELIFDPTKIQFNEVILLILMPFMWRYKKKKNARKNTE